MENEIYHIRKVMGSEIKTKNLNRIMCELSRQLSTNCFFSGNKVIQEKITMTIYDMYWELVKMDDIYYKYINLEQALSDDISSQVEIGVSSIAEIEYDDPNVVFKGWFDQFFWHLQRVVRYRIKFLNIIYSDFKDWEDGNKRRKKLYEFIKESKLSQSGKEYYFDMLKAHGKVLLKYKDIRNSFEHSENERNNFFEIIPFSLSIENNAVKFNQMQYKDKDWRCSCSFLMKTAFENIYYHIEDFFELLLNINIKDGFYIKRVLVDSKVDLEPYEIDLKNFSYDIFMTEEFRKKFNFG